jgi:hypothetical protein
MRFAIQRTADGYDVVDRLLRRRVAAFANRLYAAWFAAVQNEACPPLPTSDADRRDACRDPLVADPALPDAVLVARWRLLAHLAAAAAELPEAGIDRGQAMAAYSRVLHRAGYPAVVQLASDPSLTGEGGPIDTP